MKSCAAHVEPLLEAGVRELLEEKIAAAALAAAAVNVERYGRVRGYGGGCGRQELWLGHGRG